MKPIFLGYSFLLLFAACDNSSYDSRAKRETLSSRENRINVDSEYDDGEWCADVEYYNANTGTRNTYTLDVEVENGKLVRIDWPNGGWLDESHFVQEDITSGECSFISDKGYEYTITLKEKGSCGSGDSYRMSQDIEDDINETICPKCGEEKDANDKICDDCQNKIETCPKCYGHKFEWERICTTCKEELAEENSDNEEGNE